MTETARTPVPGQDEQQAALLHLPKLFDICSYCNGQWLKPNPAYAEHADRGRMLLNAAIEARRAAGLNGGEEDPGIVDRMSPYGDRMVTDPLHDRLGPAAGDARVATEAWRLHEASQPTGPGGHPEPGELYCVECDGHSGYQPTPAGRQLLEFLRIFG